MTIALFVVITLSFRLRPSIRRARQMTAYYIFFAIVLAVLWRATPEDLGFISKRLLTEPLWADFLASLFFFSAAFFGGILQLYNLADRGFSLRMLIDALECQTGKIDAEYLMMNYGSGKGIEWMYKKRIEGMLESGFVSQTNSAIVLQPKGVTTARIFIALRNYLRQGSIS